MKSSFAPEKNGMARGNGPIGNEDLNRGTESAFGNVLGTATNHVRIAVLNFPLLMSTSELPLSSGIATRHELQYAIPEQDRGERDSKTNAEANKHKPKRL